VRVCAIIEESIRLLRASLPSTIDIQSNIATEARALGDPTQVQQVIMNLCTNAAHAMRKGGGTLRISLCEIHLDPEDTGRYPDLQPGPYLRLVVNDTGQGIEPWMIEKVFDPFFTTKGPKEGTGLGLTVVHGIVKSHGGIITVKSEPGKRATFKILLPRIDDGEKCEKIEDKPISGGSERILFVDDEPPIAQWAQTTLERFGYKVTSRTNSLEALDLFRTGSKENGFDLVVTDMTMPGMTGLHLAEELMLLQPGIPIILCTGFSEMVTPEKAGRLGISAFLMKPLMMRELVGAIRSVLDNAGCEMGHESAMAI
jgi:CheY-like chemotaxis protein